MMTVVAKGEITFYVREDLQMYREGLKCDQVDNLSNMEEANMMGTMEGTKFMMEFGMGELEVYQGEERKKRRVFLQGLEMGMELSSRRDGTGRGRVVFLMA
jgi:hypothetical protein